MCSSNLGEYSEDRLEANNLIYQRYLEKNRQGAEAYPCFPKKKKLHNI